MKHIVIDARIRRSSTGRPIARFVERIAQYDTKARYTIILESDDTWQPKSDNIFTLRVPYKQFSFSLIEQVRFAWLLYSLKADSVFFSMTQFPLLFWHKNITVFTHDLSMFRFAHARNTHKLLHSAKLAGYKLLFWTGHKKARRIIVPTKFVEQDLVAYQPWTKDKIIQIYEATDTSSNILPLKPDVHLPRDFVFFVGNAFPHKNLYKLVDAVDIARQKQNVQLVLAGKRDNYLSDLEKYIDESGLTENVTILGFVSDAELAWLYKNALAFMYPSLSEGFGLPPLEAMANDCAVITSNTSCMPEVCGDAAYYIDPHDADSIAKGIIELVSNPKIKSELIRKGKKQITKYSWDAMAREILTEITQSPKR